MKAKSNHAVRFFALCLAVLLVCSVLIWGLASNWGKVDIKRITITGDDGSLISSLVYVPKTATNENPAQVVMIFHGRSNHAHSNDTWSMELARRGYVVFSPDLSGGGQSDVNDRQAQAIALTKYVTTLNYVDCSNMTVVGYSAGCGTTAQVAMALPEYVKNVVQVMSPMLIHEINIDTPINWCIIKGQADQYNYEFVGDLEACRQRVTEYFNLPETVEYDKDYVVDKGTLRYNMATDFALHQTANVSADSIQYLVDYITYINPTDANTIANTDMVWGWHQIISGVACVTMMFFLASMINLLMQLDFFSKAANVVTLRAPQRGAKAWILDLVFTILIPALIFIHVSAYAIKWFGDGTPASRILTSPNLTGIMAWLLVVAAIGVVRMIIKAHKAKTAGTPLALSNYCLGGADETRIDWSKPAKGLLIGVICATVVFVWLGALEQLTGINYQVWNLSTYLPLTTDRFFRAIPYVIIIFVVMFIGNMNQRVLPSTGNERRDLWIAVAVNTVMTAAALAILLIIQYGGNLAIGTGQAVFPQIDVYGTGVNTSVGSLDFAFGYCYMMGGTTGVVTYIYRKYGNIWLGVIPCAIFAGLVTLSGFTLVA